MDSKNITNKTNEERRQETFNKALAVITKYASLVKPERLNSEQLIPSYKVEDYENAVTELIKAYNTLVAIENETHTLYCEMVAKRVCEVYKAFMKGCIFTKLAKADNPMLSAVLLYSYSVRTIKHKTIKGSTKYNLEPSTKKICINPIEFDSFLNFIRDKENPHQSEWVDYLSVLNYLLTSEIAGTLNLGELDGYKMSSEAWSYVDLYKENFFIDRNGVIKQLYQTTVNSMLGDSYKEAQIKDEDVFYLRLSHNRVSRPAEITCLNDYKYSEHLFMIINKMLTDRGFTLKYQGGKIEYKPQMSDEDIEK